MRIETNIRTDSQGKRLLYISVACDECCAMHTFAGEKKEIPGQLRFAGWTVSRTGVVRCKADSQKQNVAVHAGIGANRRYTGAW